MKSITIHDLDDDLARKLEVYAKERSQSLNKSIKSILRASLGLPQETRYADYSDVCGVWTVAEADAFDAAVEDLEQIEDDE